MLKENKCDWILRLNSRRVEELKNLTKYAEKLQRETNDGGPTKKVIWGASHTLAARNSNVHNIATVVQTALAANSEPVKNASRQVAPRNSESERFKQKEVELFDCFMLSRANSLCNALAIVQNTST